MKAIKILLCVLLFNVSAPAAVVDWGETGHRATGEIASYHLSKKAKKAIAKLLDGQSLALVSTYGDEIKSDPNYREFGPWHYVNYPFGSDYETGPKSERGDVIQGINKCIAVLTDDTATREDKAFYLKMLVHFVGDLHQPLHVGIAEDRGGNTFQVQWFDDGTNLHRIWDSSMIDHYNMSYTELAENRRELSKRQIEELQKGTVIDWMKESRAICEDVYANTKVGANLKWEYSYRYMNTVRFQIQKGGIRLAKILNEIFG